MGSSAFLDDFITLSDYLGWVVVYNKETSALPRFFHFNQLTVSKSQRE